MIMRLNGSFDTIFDEWRDINHIIDMVNRTSPQHLPIEIKKHSIDSQKVDNAIRRSWLVLNNNKVKFIRSSSTETNTFDRPYDVTDEMCDMLSDCWFTCNKDLYLFSDGVLYSSTFIKIYLNSMMRRNHDLAKLVVDKNKKHYTGNIYDRAWSYYLMLNHRESLNQIITDTDRLGQIIMLENFL